MQHNIIVGTNTPPSNMPKQILPNRLYSPQGTLLQYYTNSAAFRIHYTPFCIARDITVKAMVSFISNNRVGMILSGIYSTNYSNSKPNALLAKTAIITSSGVSNQVISALLDVNTLIKEGEVIYIASQASNTQTSVCGRGSGSAYQDIFGLSETDLPTAGCFYENRTAMGLPPIANPIGTASGGQCAFLKAL